MTPQHIEMRASSLILVFMLISSSAFGQVKYEREYRIKAAEVPQQALDYVGQMQFDKKVKWYREEGLGTWSLEAKSTMNGRLYSVEFDSLGNLEDVEIQTRWNAVSPALRSQIGDYLENEFERYRIRRVQEHWKPSGTDSVQPPSLEIVVRGKTAEGLELIEYLFTHEGSLVQRSKVLLRNTDNLEF